MKACTCKCNDFLSNAYSKVKRINGFLYSLCLTNSRIHTPYYIITRHYHMHNKIKKRDINGQDKSCKTLLFFEWLKPDQKLSLRLHFLSKGTSDGDWDPNAKLGKMWAARPELLFSLFGLRALICAMAPSICARLHEYIYI